MSTNDEAIASIAWKISSFRRFFYECSMLFMTHEDWLDERVKEQNNSHK